MQFAINYSPEAEQLLRAGEIQIDVWKCPDWRDLVDRAKAIAPVYVHFPFDLGLPDMGLPDLDLVERWIEETGTPFVNAHLNAEKSLLGNGQEMRSRFLQNLAVLTKRFGAERVIAENVVWRGEEGKYLYESVDPVVISEIVEESGCGFLLDTAHAMITVGETGNDIHSYIEALPMHALKELHVTGVQFRDFVRDSMPMTEADWSLVEWLGPRLGLDWPEPWCIAFEYGGVGPIFEWRSDSQVIRDQSARLRAIACRNP